MTDLKALRAIAEAATPGPWEHYRDPDYERDAVVRDSDENELLELGLSENMENDAAHIAAFNPAQAIALLDEVDRLRNLLGEAVAQHDECCVNERICDCHDRIAAIRKEAGVE